TVPLRPAVLSGVWSRGVEALGLGPFLVLAPLVLELPAPLWGLEVGAGAALVAALALTRVRGLGDLIAKLPASLRAGAAELAEMSWGGRLIAPTALALVSWAAEWATFHLTLRAVHIPASYAASFTALIAVNVGGLIRVTPANVGVMQAALVGALVPFGVAADQAVAGGLARQAVEVLPVLGLASRSRRRPSDHLGRQLRGRAGEQPGVVHELTRRPQRRRPDRTGERLDQYVHHHHGAGRGVQRRTGRTDRRRHERRLAIHGQPERTERAPHSLSGVLDRGQLAPRRCERECCCVCPRPDNVRDRHGVRLLNRRRGQHGHADDRCVLRRYRHERLARSVEGDRIAAHGAGVRRRRRR